MTHSNKRIIIEGCDGVGKDTFIELFLAYINGWEYKGIHPKEVFGGRNLMQSSIPMIVRKRDSKTFDPELMEPDAYEKLLEDFHRHPKRYHTSLAVDVPRWGTIFSAISIHSSDSSPEAKQFLARLDQGLVTDQNEIAKEYLQIHYDLERLARTLEETHSLVVHNRSLVSYYAMQLHALKLEEHADNWGKLWRWADQKNAIFVHLTMPEDALRERLRARQKDDFRGDVEDLYMAKALAIDEGFQILKRGDTWTEVFTFDVNCPTSAYEPYFEAILRSHATSNLYAEAQLGRNEYIPTTFSSDGAEEIDELEEDNEPV